MELWTLILAIASIAVFTAWIMTLVKLAKAKEWLWFVLSLIFPVVFIVYWVIKWLK